MSGPWYIPLPTARGQVYVYPQGVESVTAGKHATTPVIITHSQYGAARVYLTWEDTRGLIERLPPAYNCNAYLSQCYRRRGTEEPNDRCLSCQLARLCLSRGQGDYREPLPEPEQPLKVPIAFGAAFALAMVIFGRTMADSLIRQEPPAMAARGTERPVVDPARQKPVPKFKVPARSQKCKHEWKLCAKAGSKTKLGVSLLLRGCAKCGEVRRYLEGKTEICRDLHASPSNEAGFVIVSLKPLEASPTSSTQKPAHTD